LAPVGGVIADRGLINVSYRATTTDQVTWQHQITRHQPAA